MNKFDKIWNEHYFLLQEYVHENEKMPACNVIYKGTELGKWLANQRNFFKKGKMPESRKEVFDSNFPDWLNPDKAKEKKEELWKTYCKMSNDGTPIENFLQDEELHTALKNGIYNCETWIKNYKKVNNINKALKVAECYAVIYPYISATYLTLLMDVYDCHEFECVTKMIEELPFENASDMETRIESILETCTDLESTIIRYSYGLETGSPVSHEKISEYFEISNSFVRHKLSKVMRKLKDPSRKSILYDVGELNYLDLPQKDIAELYRHGCKSITDVIRKLHDIDSMTISDIKEKLHIIDVHKDEIELLCKNIYMLDDIPLQNCDFSVRTCNCLKRAGIRNLKELALKSEDDLMRMPNLGQKSLEEIQAVLDSKRKIFKKTFDFSCITADLQKRIDICKKYPNAILYIDCKYVPLKIAKELF